MYKLEPKMYYINYAKKSKMQKFKRKKELTQPYKNLCQGKKEWKIAEIRAKKAPNTTQKNYAKKIKLPKFEPKKHLTLPYKNFAMKKKITNSRKKKSI